jgi:hypothetical protein
MVCSIMLLQLEVLVDFCELLERLLFGAQDSLHLLIVVAIG